MKSSRFIALLLLTALLTGTFSCGDSGTPKDSDTQGTQDTSSAETTDPIDARKAISDDLPDRNFNGDVFTILTFDGTLKDSYIESATGDVIDDAVFKRNQAVEERFNCKIEAMNIPNHRDSVAHIQKTVMADEDEFSLISTHVVALSGITTQDLLMNWYDFDYINFDKPWWSRSTVDDLTYGNDKAVLAIGDFALSALSGAYCYFYDKPAAEDYQLGNLYEVVNDGKWTIDYIMNITKDIYRDLNGNNERDAADYYGLTQTKFSAANAYLWAFGNKIIDKKSDGSFEIVYKNERLNTIVDKIYQLVYESEGVCSDRLSVYPESHHTSAELSFRDNLSLFSSGFLSMAVNTFREKSSEYGILPYPKLNEAQDDYYTMVDGSHAALAVPKTISDSEFVGIITEALNAESYKTVYPAYYEVALKAKYTYDDESVAMLDKIVESRVFDFGYVYDNWEGMSFYIQTLLHEKKSKDIESYYASNSASAIKHYNEVFEYFENMQ